MKILLTADTVGGVWTYALDLADALAAHDVEVQLATMGRRLDRSQRRAVEASAVAGVHESMFRLEWEQDAWDDVDRAGAWLVALEDDLAPDVIHLNGYAHGALPWRSPVVVVAHSDVVSWWRAVKHVSAPPEWTRYHGAVEAGLRAASVLCAPTQAVLDDLGRSYAFRTPTRVIPNGRPAPAPGGREKEPFVFAAGRFWDEAKNMDALAAVAARSDWPLVLAGDGAPLGRKTPAEIAGYLSRASIYAAPVRYEPFGLGILEAALAGCALVLGDVASLREVWGDVALYVDPDDHVQLAAALRLLQRDGELRAELGQRANRRAARYTPDAMAAGYAAVYDTVCAQVGAAA